MSIRRAVEHLLSEMQLLGVTGMVELKLPPLAALHLMDEKVLKERTFAMDGKTTVHADEPFVVDLGLKVRVVPDFFRETPVLPLRTKVQP